MKPLVIVQCCKDKTGAERFPGRSVNLQDLVLMTRHVLAEGVRHFRAAFDFNTPQVTALSRYNGHFYRTPDLRREVGEAVSSGCADCIIMSAGYGLVHAFQRIHTYNKEMKGEVTDYWIRAGLPGVLAEYARNAKVTRVVGIFSRTSGYRQVFEQTPWAEASASSGISEAGYFYVEGSGTAAVLRAQGELLLQLLRSDFRSPPERVDHLPIQYRKLFP